MMDDLDRDKFYSTTSDNEDDGAEYELEPPDAEVLAAEERRAKEEIEATLMSVDIDEIYREAERQRGSEILEGWLRNFRFQFQVKHLLIATAVLAIVLTLARWQMLGTVVVLLVMFSVAGLFLYLQWQEKKQQDEADRRRQALYARRRAKFGAHSPAAAADEKLPPSVAEPLPSEVDEVWQQASARQEFRFRFSLFELLAAMTAAAITFGLLHVLGGPSNTATLLGFVALFGLVVHALGFDPPQIIVLGWWLILVLYVLLSIVAVIWAGVA